MEIAGGIADCCSGGIEEREDSRAVVVQEGDAGGIGTTGVFNGEREALKGFIDGVIDDADPDLEGAGGIEDGGAGGIEGDPDSRSIEVLERSR